MVQQLKEEAAEAHQVAKEMEDKYRGTAEELDATRAKLESAWLRNQQLELELKAGSRGNAPLSKQMSSKKLAASTAAMPNGKTGPESDEESEYTEETETETESGKFQTAVFWTFLNRRLNFTWFSFAWQIKSCFFLILMKYEAEFFTIV